MPHQETPNAYASLKELTTYSVFTIQKGASAHPQKDGKELCVSAEIAEESLRRESIIDQIKKFNKEGSVAAKRKLLSGSKKENPELFLMIWMQKTETRRMYRHSYSWIVQKLISLNGRKKGNETNDRFCWASTIWMKFKTVVEDVQE